LEFAHLVAEEIQAAFGRAAVDELLLAAPPRIVNAIRDKLTVGTAATLVGTLGKDLTKVPDDELRPHLREWLDAPPHRS
jgi:protein required for attachment to host cells